MSEAEKDAPRRPTIEEAEAILTLVNGGWLHLRLALDESTVPTAVDRILSECDRLARAADEYDQAGQHEYAGVNFSAWAGVGGQAVLERMVCKVVCRNF